MLYAISPTAPFIDAMSKHLNVHPGELLREDFLIAFRSP